VTNSLATQYPELATEWHPTKNGNLTPSDVVAGSHKKVWWKCAKGPDHEWEAALRNRTGLNRGCRRKPESTGFARTTGEVYHYQNSARLE